VNLGVNGYGESGNWEQLTREFGIDSGAIKKSVEELLTPSIGHH
jgi:transketolase